MQSINIRHKFNLHRYKVVLLALLISVISAEVKGQNIGTLNLPNFDEQKVHYGFLLGGHVSRYKLQYNEAFTTPDQDSIHSIVPKNLFGFKLGFIVNFHLWQYLDVRVNPTIGFYQLGLDYRFTDETTLEELRDPTYVELPIMLKYKSVRRENRRMYLLAGINPSIRASGSKGNEDATERLLTKGFNMALEFGVGFDIYQPFFKFSPEVRYTYGLTNALSDEPNDFSAGIENLTIHSFTIYFCFEGGPSELKRRKK